MTDTSAAVEAVISLRRRLDQSAPLVIAVAALVAMPALVVWACLTGGIDTSDLPIPVAVACAAAFLAACAIVATVRALPAAPFLVLTGEELLVRDRRAMGADWVIPKEVIERAEVIVRRRFTSNWPRADECACSPFDENWTVRIRFSQTQECPVAYTGLFGNWIWKVLFARSSQPVGGPRRNHPYRGVVCCPADPTQAVSTITAWLAGPTPY